IFLIVSSGSPRALIASSLRSTSKKPFCPITRPLHPPMTAHGHRVRFVATWREEFFEVPYRRFRSWGFAVPVTAFSARTWSWKETTEFDLMSEMLGQASSLLPEKSLQDLAQRSKVQSFESGRIEARTGLRMMPTFPRPSLSFRTAGFPQYGW